MPRKPGLKLASTASLLIFAIACSGQEGTRRAMAASFADRPETLPYSSELNVTLQPGDRFEFCPEARGLNLINARWLAFLSANEYAHFGELGPVLEELGFGHEGEGRGWSYCARDLYALRALELRGELPEVLTEAVLRGWGSCARRWYHDRYGDGPAYSPPSVAADFERWLIHEVRQDQLIQFFSQGEFSRDGERFRTGSTQALFARHGSMPLVVVAFRGTELRRGQRLQDVGSDLDARWRSIDGWGHVHCGFDASLSSIDEGLLLDKLAELEGTGAAIWLTGHSLGAALATLMTARLLDAALDGADLRVAGLYTFGSPRVGDQEFAEVFEDAASQLGTAIFRFRRGNDVVTRIPFSMTTAGGFQHVGRLVWLTQEGELVVDPEEVSHGVRDLVSDHDICGYHQRILEHAGDPALARFTGCP